MKIVRISFEGFEKNKETNFILVGDYYADKKNLKKEINRILNKMFKR